jgi:hypothetical protein
MTNDSRSQVVCRHLYGSQPPITRALAALPRLRRPTARSARPGGRGGVPAPARHGPRYKTRAGEGKGAREETAGDDAELDLRLREGGVVAGVDDVAHHRQLAPAAQSEAVDGLAMTDCGSDVWVLDGESIRTDRDDRLARCAHSPPVLNESRFEAL